MSLLGICNITASNHRGVKKAETTAHNAHDSGPNFESKQNLSAVEDWFLMLSLIL